MHISIEKGKMLIITLMAVGPLVEGRAQREVWFEVNGEVRHLTPDTRYKFVELYSSSFVPLQLKIRTLLWKRYLVRRLLRTLDPSELPCPALLLK
jgi:hypothetical protein